MTEHSPPPGPDHGSPTGPPSAPTAPPGSNGYREVTIAAVVFAIVIGVVMNAAITYAGLKIGFTIGGSAIAAVLGFGVLRGLLRRGSILETNIAQTIASTVNTSNSGVIFTVPVLLLLGFALTPRDAEFWLILLACIAGAFLGTAFIIPLRKQMIDIERLRFPSPTGVALILKSPGAGAKKAVVLVAGMILGALIYLPAGLPGIQRTMDVAALEELVESGEISRADAERTRRIAAMIEAQAAPEALVRWGEAVIDRRALDVEIPKRRRAGVAVADLEERRAEIVAAVDALREQNSAIALFSESLAVAVARAARGERPWEDLRDRGLGWVSQRLPGYGRLGWTLPSEYDEARAQRLLGADWERASPVQLAGRIRAITDPSVNAARLAAILHDDFDAVPADRQAQRIERALDALLLTIRVDRDRDGRVDQVLTDSTVDVGRSIGLPDQVRLIFAIAPFALGAGYLTGRAGLFVLAGGILAFFVINPLTFSLGWMPATETAQTAPDYAFSQYNRPLGIGLLLGGALMGVLASLPAIREAVRSIFAAAATKKGSDELGFRTIAIAVVLGLVFLFLAADFIGGQAMNPKCPVTQQVVADDVPTAEWQGYQVGFSSTESRTAWDGWTNDARDAWLRSVGGRRGLLAGLPAHVRAAIIAVVGAVWIWFAGIIIAQCAGMTDWSPISGIALLTVILILLLAGTGSVVGAVMIGAALCVAITLASDMMGDLKTGYIVGSIPKRQQLVELATVWIGPVVCMFTLMLIVAVNQREVGIPIGPGTETTAPQAQALQAVITGVQGGQMPYALYGLGAMLGGLLGLGAFAGLGVLVGLSMYLPFMYISTYGIGCIINMVVAKMKGRTWAEEWGVPFAAGLVVGESMLSLGINCIVLLS